MDHYRDEINKIIARYPADRRRSAVMPILFLAQAENGHITANAVNEIAEILDISSTDVASILGFYTLFHAEPEGRYRIQVCTDLPCALRGADQFLKDLCAFLGIDTGQTTSDGLFTIEEVKCLAACHRAPIFQLQGDGEITYHENQTLELVKDLVNDLRAGAEHMRTTA